MWRLLLLVALIVALIALGSLDVIDTFKQVMTNSIVACYAVQDRFPLFV